ncbi:MAG TPA: PRC-barrel domain-containing protein [Woeseiaceae bacterium]|jgi:sporulation protein YlmC with PRC-barrel domain
MKKTAAILAGIMLASGTTWAALQESATQSTDPHSSTQSDEPTGDPEMGTLPEGENAYGEEVGEQSAHDLSQMSAEELAGRTVMTTSGEEIGTIEQVGYSSTDQEKVATINVGGFLGVGEKLIAVPLSELQMGSDDSLQTTMTREEIQSQPEFDPSSLSTDEQPQSEDKDW